MDTTYQNFKLFGISEKEAAIYLFLKKNGEHTALEISRVTNIPKSTVYFCLEKLIDNGLIVVVMHENSKKFNAYPLSALQELISSQENKLHKMNQGYDELRKNTAFNKSLKQTHTKVKFYQGITGLKQIIWNALDSKDLAQWLTFKRVQLFGEKFYVNYATIFRNKKISQRSIINPNSETIEYIKKNLHSPKVHTKINEMRGIDKDDFNIEYDTLIYDNVYACIMWLQKELVGFEIENETFVKSQLMMFNFFWKNALPLGETNKSKSF